MSTEDAKKVSRADRTALGSCHSSTDRSEHCSRIGGTKAPFLCVAEVLKSYLCVLDSGPKPDDWRANGMQGPFSKASDFSE